MKKRIIRKIPIVIALAALGIFTFTGIVMLLWNGILPGVLHVGAITFWQAAGILLLAKILFGSHRGRGRMAGAWCKSRMMRKWADMTPEEREKLRETRGCYHRFETAGAQQAG